jgi:alkanesulfonate monooxygenase SsuD/methylene tetrahydromethanopterin reductase-like flavin-dependent oxidoreductase (luciferase family)
LGEENAIVTLFDEIPKGDRRRTSVAIYGANQLVEMRRYDLAMEGSDAVQMIANFDMQSKTPQTTLPRPGQLGSAVRSALQDIEILAGGGDLAHARELADKVMAFDPSPETRALIQQRAERAGRPDFLANRRP